MWMCSTINNFLLDPIRFQWPSTSPLLFYWHCKMLTECFRSQNPFDVEIQMDNIYKICRFFICFYFALVTNTRIWWTAEYFSLIFPLFPFFPLFLLVFFSLFRRSLFQLHIDTSTSTTHTTQRTKNISLVLLTRCCLHNEIEIFPIRNLIFISTIHHQYQYQDHNNAPPLMSFLVSLCLWYNNRPIRINVLVKWTMRHQWIIFRCFVFESSIKSIDVHFLADSNGAQNQKQKKKNPINIQYGWLQILQITQCSQWLFGSCFLLQSFECANVEQYWHGNLKPMELYCIYPPKCNCGKSQAFPWTTWNVNHA